MGRGVRPRALRGRRRPTWSSSPGPSTRPRRRRARPASRHPTCVPRHGCTPPGRTRRSTTASGSPSTARARRWSWGWPTSRCSPATSGARASGSTRCAARTTCRGRATWGRSRTSCPGYRHVSRPEVREIYESLWGVTIQAEPGLRIPNMFDSAIGGSFKGLYVQGEDIAQSDPNTQHVEAALRSMELVVVHDLFLNETARFAHVFLPGASFLEKDGTFTNAERRINRVRPVMPSRVGKDEWQVVCEIATAMGYPMSYADAVARSWTRSPPRHRRSRGCPSRALDAEGSMQWPVTEAAPHGTPTMHVGLVRARARASSRRRSTCRRPSAPTAATRWCSRPGGSCRSTTSARRPAARPTRPGTPRTSSRSTPRMPSCAASRPVTSSSCRRGSARRGSPRWSPSGCRPASSTRRSTTR